MWAQTGGLTSCQRCTGERILQSRSFLLVITLLISAGLPLCLETDRRLTVLNQVVSFTGDDESIEDQAVLKDPVIQPSLTYHRQTQTLPEIRVLD